MLKRSPRTAKTASERVSERLAPVRARFYDASAIAKAYLDEAATADVRRWMGEGEVIVSRLSEVEVPSAITRRSREGFASVGARDLAIHAFLDDIDHWAVIELTGELARRAVGLLAAHPIRAGDAIQLASALVARDRIGSIIGRFVAYDSRLLAAARLEGFLIQEY